MKQMKTLRSLFALFTLSLAGCATFHPQPVSPEETAANFDARSLADEQLRAFLETNGVPVKVWPIRSWDLDHLTLAAFYFNPDLAVARAAHPRS